MLATVTFNHHNNNLITCGITDKYVEP